MPELFVYVQNEAVYALTHHNSIKTFSVIDKERCHTSIQSSVSYIIVDGYIKCL